MLRGHPEPIPPTYEKIDNRRPLLLRQLLKRWHPGLPILEYPRNLQRLQPLPDMQQLGYLMPIAFAIRAMTSRAIRHIQPISHRQLCDLLPPFLPRDHPEQPGCIIGILIKDAVGVDSIAAPFGPAAIAHQDRAHGVGRQEFIRGRLGSLIKNSLYKSMRRRR